jgi:uncharacterized protein (TIGR02145 family)
MKNIIRVTSLLCLIVVFTTCKEDSELLTGSSDLLKATQPPSPISLPSVTTSFVYNISRTAATVKGNVTSDGGTPVLERGVYYSTSANPEITGTKLQIGSGMGIFSSNLKGLTPNTTYYVKAYVTNSTVTRYGSQVFFTTHGSVTDIDGNVYKTITIGTQKWMGENLKTTKYSDGSNIPECYNGLSWSNQTTGVYCWCNNEVNSIYGALYNGYTVMDSRNLCPTGWHVPTDAEWTTLANYLGGASVAGGKLKETGFAHWLWPNTDATNEIGFDALPGGDRFPDGTFYYIKKYGFFWTSTLDDGFLVVHYTLYDWSNIFKNAYYQKHGFSVRCMKD